MASDAEGQEKQRDNIIQKAKILCFQGHTASFAIQQGIFCTMWPYVFWIYSGKGPQDSLCKRGGGGGWGIFQGIYSFPGFPRPNLVTQDGG